MYKKSVRPFGRNFPLDQLSKYMDNDLENETKYPKGISEAEGHKNRKLLLGNTQKSHSKSLYYQKYEIKGVNTKTSTVKQFNTTNVKRNFTPRNTNLQGNKNSSKTSQNQKLSMPKTKQNNQTSSANERQRKITEENSLNEHLIGSGHKLPIKSYMSVHNNPITRKKDTQVSSLRASSSYLLQLNSVAGVPLNNGKMDEMRDNHLNTTNNMRNFRQKQLEKANQRISKRLNSQESHYSNKKFLKDSTSQMNLSKRLTSSKISQRSSRSSVSNQSQTSQQSSCSSFRSNTSKVSKSSLTKSQKKIQNTMANRINAKFNNKKSVKIVEHNINNVNDNELNKFKSLFANSFKSSGNSAVNPEALQQNQQKNKYFQNLIKSNPYVDVEIKSLTQIPLFRSDLKVKANDKTTTYLRTKGDCKSSEASLRSSTRNYVQDVQDSLYQQSQDVRNRINNSKSNKNKITVYSSSPNENMNPRNSLYQNSHSKAGQKPNDGSILHRIAEQMYSSNSSIQGVKNKASGSQMDRKKYEFGVIKEKQNI